MPGATEGFSLLVIRLELDSDTKTRAIRDFLGFEVSKLVNTNTASEMDYVETSPEFVSTVKLPLWYNKKRCVSRGTSLTSTVRRLSSKHVSGGVKDDQHG